MISLSLPQALLSQSAIGCQSKFVDHLEEKEGQSHLPQAEPWLYYYIPGPLSLTSWLHIHTRYWNVDWWWISSFILRSQIWWPATSRTISSFITLYPIENSLWPNCPTLLLYLPRKLDWVPLSLLCIPPHSTYSSHCTSYISMTVSSVTYVSLGGRFIFMTYVSISLCS